MDSRKLNTKNNKTTYVDRPFHEKFRKLITGKTSNFYILCQLTGDENTSIFTAVKLDKSDNKLDSAQYSVKYLSKDWVSSLLDKFQCKDFDSFYNFYKDSFPKFQDLYKNRSNLKEKSILELEDFIKDQDGIYLVQRYAPYSLRTYVTSLQKFKNTIFETKVRKLIEQIVNILCLNTELQISTCFGAYLNLDDIMITESMKDDFTDKSEITVKFCNPFMSEFFTIVKIYDENKFPSFYAPELFELFNESSGLKEKKNVYDLSDFVSKMNQSMDMWSLGFAIYEILFHEPPFRHDDLSKAQEFYYQYEMYPNRITETMKTIINSCLLHDIDQRLSIKTLQSYKTTIEKENLSIEEIERNLKKNYESEALFRVRKMESTRKIDDKDTYN